MNLTDAAALAIATAAGIAQIGILVLYHDRHLMAATVDTRTDTPKEDT